jgi:hypothetical protein
VRKDPAMRTEIFNMYPTYQDNFLEYENIIYQIAKLVRYYYVQRYIKNKYVTLPKEEYILMKRCHEWYLQNREENRINVAKVMEILDTEQPVSLYKMIRRYQINQSTVMNPTLDGTEFISLNHTHSSHPVIAVSPPPPPVPVAPDTSEATE